MRLAVHFINTMTTSAATSVELRVDSQEIQCQTTGFLGMQGQLLVHL